MQHKHLIAAFQNVSGASFVGIDTLTEVPLRGGKLNPHQGRVTKRMVGAQVMVFQNKKTSAYDSMIKRRLVLEGKDPAKFVLSPRAWGTRIPNMPIVEHFKDGETKYYLEVIFLKPGPIEYLLDGIHVDEVDIVGLQAAIPGEQGGLDDKVIIRTFAAESIVEIRIDGHRFV